MIEVNEVSKRYGNVQALKDISFHVPKGQVLGLLGQNGAGKTTLLSILSGFMAPDSGKVLINGKDMLLEPLLAKGEIGYLPESPPLYPEMSVTEYLSFCCQLKGVIRGQRKRHMDELITLCGLESVHRRLCGQLSRGYRQRLGLAQALCGDPQVILLDEPSAGFDPAQAIEFRETIASLAKSHVILFSSHILAEVQAICDRVLIIHEGRLVYDHTMHGGSADSAMRFELHAKYDSKLLIPALRGLPSVQRVKQLGDLIHGQCFVEVETCANAPFQEELFRLLTGLGAPILMLKPLEDSIEEVFLRITSASEPGRSPA